MTCWLFGWLSLFIYVCPIKWEMVKPCHEYTYAVPSVSVFYLFLLLLLPLFLYDWFYGPPKQRKWFLWLFSCLTNFYYIPKFSHTQTTSTYACKREASMPRFWCEGIKRIFSVLEIGVKHTGCFKRCNFPIRLFYQEVRAQFDLFLFFPSSSFLYMQRDNNAKGKRWWWFTPVWHTVRCTKCTFTTGFSSHIFSQKKL